MTALHAGAPDNRRIGPRTHLPAQRRLPGPIGTVRSVGYVLNADVEYVDARH